MIIYKYKNLSNILLHMIDNIMSFERNIHILNFHRYT